MRSVAEFSESLASKLLHPDEAEIRLDGIRRIGPTTNAVIVQLNRST